MFIFFLALVSAIRYDFVYTERNTFVNKENNFTITMHNGSSSFNNEHYNLFYVNERFWKMQKGDQIKYAIRDKCLSIDSESDPYESCFPCRLYKYRILDNLGNDELWIYEDWFGYYAPNLFQLQYSILEPEKFYCFVEESDLIYCPFLLGRRYRIT